MTCEIFVVVVEVFGGCSNCNVHGNCVCADFNACGIAMNILPVVVVDITVVVLFVVTVM
jgi:hypothetical protein